MTTDNRTNEPTPNPTAEQIALRALHPEATRNLPLASIYAKRICHDLRAHGLLSEGAPTEEQVKAEAWDEGFGAGVDHSIFNEFVFNPHTKYSEQAKKYIEKRLSEDTK